MNKALLVALCSSVIVLTGCTSKEKQECQNTVNSFLTEYSNCDGAAGEYLYYGGDEIEFKGIQAVIAKEITFEVHKAVKNDGGYTVDVTILAPDFKGNFEMIAADATEETAADDIIRSFSNLLESDSVVMRTFEIPIIVVPMNDQYKIEMTEELSNALFGGFNEYISEIIGETNYGE